MSRYRESLVYGYCALFLFLINGGLFAEASESSEPHQGTATAIPTGTAPVPTPVACPTLECPGCPGPRPALEWLDEADSVFRGGVNLIDRVGCGHRVWFGVLEVWKGPLTTEQSVWIDLTSWQCMRRYEIDDVGIIFARADTDGGLHVPMCFGITDRDVEADLGPGTPVGGSAGTITPPATSTPTPSHAKPLWLPLLGKTF